MGPQIVFGVLLISAVYGQDSKSDYQLEMGKLAESLRGSSLLKQGLTGTVPPYTDEKFEPLKLPSKDQVNEFIEIEAVNFQKTEIQNKELSKIDKENKETPVFGPHLLTDDESIRINKPGNIMSGATARIVQNARGQRKEKQFLDSTARVQIFDLIDRLRIAPLPICPYLQPISCNSAYEYRTIDGSCNNIGNPYWGKSHTPFDRFLTPQYEGTSDPRAIAQAGGSLPGAREISVIVHTPSNVGDLAQNISYMIMQWGQFTDHDITKTALSKVRNDMDVNEQERLPESTLRETLRDCFPINIPADDSYYASNKTCLNFVRSTATPALDCSTDYRQQLNELTHFIDASNVYGSNATQLAVLRDGTTALMRVSAGNRLPLDVPNDSGCVLSDPAAKKCFLAGDKRSNVQPGLSSMHTIFVREHNRIADFIKTNNHLWTDEKVFQEARRFVSAEMQHITYNEFLPKILHNFFMTFLDLKPKALGYFGGYDTTIKPMIRNAFATAAYRFGHSFLRDRFKWGFSFPFLHTQFNNPDLLYPSQGIEKCTAGIYGRQSQGMDEKLTTEVTNKLFKTMTDLGGDLAAFNIQRGRDHGLPPYNDWLEGCYGIRANTFQPGVFGGLLFHDVNEAGKLDTAYQHPNDMDLFTAAISERHLPGSKLGPTFSCILALQFRALKYGDRFFYEGNTVHNPHPFTLPELDSIRKVTLAKVICDNTDITSLPKDVFLLPNAVTNENVKCADLPSLKLPCTPVHGGWSNWKYSSWNFCKQYRTCTNPPPNACGNKCVGKSTRKNPICILQVQPAKSKLPQLSL